MIRVLYYIGIFIIFSTGIMAQNIESSIVLMVSESNKEITQTIDQYEQLLKRDMLLKKVQKKEGFYTKTSRSGYAYILKIGPFKESDSLTLAYLRLRTLFPQAFILEKSIGNEKKPRVWSQNIKASSPKTKFIEKKVYIEKEDPVLWIALFGLGIIGILALFLSSDQIQNIKKRHVKMQKRQEETEKRQNLILAKMGEKIQYAVLKNLESETKILETPSTRGTVEEIKHKIEGMKQYDDDLLNTTYEMIDFLKIKSGSIEIHNEPFQLSTLLHKLTNSISVLLKENKNTFYYDVKTDVSRYLVGDSLRIFQVLHNILLTSLEGKEDSQNIKILLSIDIEKEKALIFKIINENQYLDKEKVDALFVPSSWEELQETNKELGFFVTNELVSQMNGIFSIESHLKKGTEYLLKLPYIKDMEEKSNKESLKEILSGKKVLIIDDDTLNMDTLKYILESFSVEVERQLTSFFKEHKPKIYDWDIVILNAKDITPIHLGFFEDMRQKRGLKVILMHEIFESEDLVDIALRITDAEIYSPVIPGDVEEVFYQLYMAPHKQKEKEISVYEHNVQTIKIPDAPDVGRESFQKFSGKHILIVEDNFVSQKVMSSILSASNVQVYKAENGRQALEILEKNPQIDLILMDMSMPVMDGFAATRKIKTDPKLQEIPVIAVTGLGFNHEIERMGQVGVDACIVKPFKIGQLYMAIDKYLVMNEKKNTLEKKNLNIDKYIPNEHILNVQQGIVNAHNEIFYREILEEVKELLEDSSEHFISMVSGSRKKELQVFCRDTLSLVETVGAVQLTKIFKEILVFLSSKQSVSLDIYISMYHKEWSRLKKEIELYLT